MIDRDSILINRENVWNTYTLLNINLFAYGIVKLFMRCLDLFLPCAFRLTLGVCGCQYLHILYIFGILKHKHNH